MLNVTEHTGGLKLKTHIKCDGKSSSLSLGGEFDDPFGGTEEVPCTGMVKIACCIPPFTEGSLDASLSECKISSADEGLLMLKILSSSLKRIE